MSERLPCPYCGKSFVDANGRWMHAKAKHQGKSLKALKVERDIQVRENDEPSMADLMIEAQLQYRMGGPVDNDWLLDAIDLDDIP